MTNISPHITYKEGTFSATAARLGLKNDPLPMTIETMKITAEKVFEPVRLHFKTPIRVISFFRSLAVNKAVGGAKHSQHMVGEAIDIQGTGGTSNADLFGYIMSSILFDQVIAEFPVNGEPAWIHVSFTIKRTNRREALVAVKLKGKTVYLPYRGNEKLVFL